ncbi:MmgE/PrpD family protein, partial [Profundibacter sp.]
MSDSGFQDGIIEFARGLEWSGVPDNVREVFRLSLLDWCAVGLAGVKEPVSVAVRDMVLAEGGTGEAFVFGTDVALPARAAALANGAISHALDFDDTHFLHIGHPSVTIFPAALAVAQRVGATGAEFLAAALAGYEASVRIGQWLGRAHYEAGFHMTATAGCFGAAIAAARLLGADVVQMGAALGLASTRASGLKAQFGSMGKPYNAGMAASAGVEAALLAVSGMTSDASGLHSFAAGHAGERNAAALEGLGQVFVTSAVSHKFHACCHGTHAALEALAKLDV